MMNVMGLWAKYGTELHDDPLLVLALTAALFALATTPIAFAVLGRMQWFKARRGRVMQRPEFASIVVGMILVMAIPAIFSAPGDQEPILRQEPLRVRPQQDLVGARSGPRARQRAGG